MATSTQWLTVMGDSVSRIKELSPAQRDLLLRRLARLENSGPRQIGGLAPRGERDGSSGDIPLSFAQERQWFLDRLTPGDPAHIITVGLRLTGRLSVSALSRAFDEILRRHSSLRANMSAPAGKPVQAIAPPSPLPIVMVDLVDRDPALSREEREEECRHRYVDETKCGFDLSRDRLLRATLVRLGEIEHFLIFSMHHIVGDGWSVGVLLEELARLYIAFVQDREADLPALPIQYGDFAEWQRRRLRGGVLRRGLAYWRKQLENPPPVLDLPADQVRHTDFTAAGRDFSGASCERVLGPRLKQDLEALSRGEDSSLFVTLLTAFMTLLMRLTGREDILIGSPVSGRIRVETEALIGLFLNTLALRAQLAPDLSFRQALARVRKSVLEGLEHHEVPFEQVVQELDPERSATNHPLFELFFNFTPSPPRVLQLPDLRAVFESPAAMRCEFSMVLYVTEWEGTLELRLAYQRARYAVARIVTLLDQFEAILHQVARDPDRPLGELDLATLLSREVLPDPTAWLDRPAREPVTGSIARWAERTPDRPALSQGGLVLTYAGFAARMTMVAQGLCSAGMTPGQVVAVHGPRCAGFIVSMAGVLHAGGVLLTLSLDLPESRRLLMLERADARFLLHAGPWREGDEWRERPGLTILAVDAAGDAQVPAEPPSESGAPAAGPRDPAYIFFTSGSTGTPKAVLGTAGGLAHFLDWQRRSFAVEPGDRCAQLTGMSFDVVLRDVFLPLTSGAELVLPVEDDMVAGGRCEQWLRSEAITLLHTVPSLAETWLLDAAPDETLPSLRVVFFAGEPLTAALVQHWRRVYGRAGTIVNLYGPTETTLAKCAYVVPDEPYAGIQPLGRPIPQTQILVLTADRRLCGIGEVGEISVRTPFRSLGYVKAEEENERRFVVNPFADDADDRLYLTGDRGMMDKDGVLHFLGRIDDQVKVHGVRVEPMEVAATLRTSPDVVSCAVVERTDSPDRPALAAYVVPSRDGQRSARRLREFLRQRLPAPMIPSVFVFLDRLPLTANQKLDRKRLPALDDRSADRESRHVAPRDAVELQLVQIWQDLLGVERIGIGDSFFDLGGHSLLALHLLVRIEQRLRRKVPLAALFEEQTIEHLANVIRRQETAASQVVKLWSGENPEILFLVHTGGGTILNYVPLVRHLQPDRPIYAVQARGLSGEAEPQCDMAEIAAEYVGKLRNIQPTGPYRLGGHSFGGVIAYEMARQLTETGQEVALLAMFDTMLSGAEDAGRLHEPESWAAARDLAGAVGIFRRFTGLEIDIAHETLCGRPIAEQIALVSDAFRRGGSPLFADGDDLVRNLLAVERAHRKARLTYRPPPSPVPITLFRASEGMLPEDDPNPVSSETLDWSEISGAPVRVLWVPGDHVTMMAEPNAGSLAERLRCCLSDRQPDATDEGVV
jgi:amino acid adenylation domain-containing protein